MAIDLSQLAFVLGAVSSLAVAAGAAFSMLERIMDGSFVRRRKNVYDSVKKHGEKDWEGFIGSWDDFEARNHG